MSRVTQLVSTGVCRMPEHMLQPLPHTTSLPEDSQCLVQTQSFLRASNLVAVCGFFHVINCPPFPASLGVSVIVKRAIKNNIIGRQRRLPGQFALRSRVPVTWV